MFVHTVSQGYGQFLENHIHCNTYAGVWVTGESEPTLKDNEVCDGQQGCVYFFGNGRGLLEGNNIHGNALAGIHIRYVHTVKFNMYIKTYLCAVRMIPTCIHMYYYEMKYVRMYRIVICVQLYSMYCTDV